MKAEEMETGPELHTEMDPEIVRLEERLNKAEQQRDDMIRTLADYENSRKRAQRDMEADRKYAQAKLAGDLLPALDNLDRALQAAKQAGEKGGLVMGVMGTQMQILDILKRHGIEKMDVLGKPFDPNLHQAVKMQQTGDLPPGNVMEILQGGYMIHDRILRPASVIVSEAPTLPVEAK